jgi:hypothetical protein
MGAIALFLTVDDQSVMKSDAGYCGRFCLFRRVFCGPEILVGCLD